VSINQSINEKEVILSWQPIKVDIDGQPSKGSLDTWVFYVNSIVDSSENTRQMLTRMNVLWHDFSRICPIELKSSSSTV